MESTPRQYVLFLFWTTFCFGLTLSPALISISLGGIALLGIIDFKWNGFNSHEKTLNILFVLFYLGTALSFFNSDNSDEASRKLVLKLPLLVFPLIINALKKTGKNSDFLIFIFLFSIYLPAVVSVYNYFSNRTLFDLLILESKPLPIEFGYGIYHIQFSILLAISILLGAYFLIRRSGLKKFDLVFYTIAFITIANFLSIHILSARTGLLALYIGILVLGISIFRKLSKRTVAIGLISAVLLPLIMYFASSSLRNRISNTIDDINVVWNNTNPNDYSFAMRVQAWRNAIDVISKHPVTGVGIGDAEKELYDNFNSFNPNIEKDNRKNPHFQSLETAVQSGMVVMFIYISIIIMIAAYNIRRRPFTAAIAILLFMASCFESILERQASIATFVIFIALMYGFESDVKKESSRKTDSSESI